MKAFASLIQHAGIPQKRLAEILGISPVVLNRYLRNVREPGLENLKIIYHAEALLDEAREMMDEIPFPQPDEAEVKGLEKELDETMTQIATLEREKKQADAKLEQARLILAWLALWEQSALHPQKPWSADFLRAQKGFSTQSLSKHLSNKVLAFDLKQAKERRLFLEELLKAFCGNDG